VLSDFVRRASFRNAPQGFALQGESATRGAYPIFTMAVRIRLKRMGRKKQPHYRVVVADGRSPRDGRFVETLGYYKPLTSPARLVLDLDRVDYWMGNGADPSNTVKSLIAKARRGGDDSLAVGEEDVEARRQREAEELAARREAEKAAAAAEAGAAAEAEAEAAAAAEAEAAAAAEAEAAAAAEAEATTDEEAPAEEEAAPEAAAASEEAPAEETAADGEAADGDEDEKAD